MITFLLLLFVLALSIHLFQNSLTGDGTPLGKYDRANARGLSVELSAKKIISAIDKKNGKFRLEVRKEWEYI